jgi:hypothetical protein
LVCTLLAGCAPLLSPPPAPTLDPGTLNSIVAQTANAAASQTASVRIETPTSIPTSTLLITTTPSEVPSVTPTFIFILSTPTKPSPTSSNSGSSGGGDDECDVLSQLPKNNTVFSPGVDFETRWQVSNTGTSIWNKDNIDYRYASGDKLHKQAIYDLSKDVPVGKLVDIIVKMKSPSDAGSYSTTWNLRQGKDAFCPMKLKIIVE